VGLAQGHLSRVNYRVELLRFTSVKRGKGGKGKKNRKIAREKEQKMIRKKGRRLHSKKENGGREGEKHGGSCLTTRFKRTEVKSRGPRQTERTKREARSKEPVVAKNFP